MSRWDIDVLRGRLDGSDGESNAFLNVTCMYLVLLIAVWAQGLRFAWESKVFAEVRSASVSRHTLPSPFLLPFCTYDFSVSERLNDLSTG